MRWVRVRVVGKVEVTVVAEEVEVCVPVDELVRVTVVVADVFVAPSAYAARHPGVVSTGLPTVIIHPGVRSVRHARERERLLF